MVSAILWYQWVEKILDFMCHGERDEPIGGWYWQYFGISRRAEQGSGRVGLIQVRLTINTVLSSISASSPFSRRWLSCCTAQSRNALQISLAERRWCSRKSLSSSSRICLSLPS